MNIRKTSAAVFSMMLALSFAGTVLAGGIGGVPAVQVQTLYQVQLTSFPALDTSRLAAEDIIGDDEGLPYRFAVAQDVFLTPENSGTWEAMTDGRLLWRHRFACPGVLSLNLGFTGYRLPRSATLLVYAADGSGPVFRFDADDNRSSGQLWTPILLTSELVIELEVAASERQNLRLELGRVSCGYRGFGADIADKSGDCNIDVICAQGDDWRDDIASIGMYTISGIRRCSGVLINNTAQDRRPLFLTANHCSVDASNVAQMVVYWNYESPSCGEHGGGTLTQFNHGSALLSASATSDFKLVELDESPDPVFGVTYAGWDRSDSVPGSAVAIHHPSTDEKSISFENDPLTITTYLENPVPGNSTHLRVIDWDEGTTEPGSSGSPLFNADHRIVGQLHGGYAACTNDLSDWYGRLFISWQGDGTAETRLRDYLDPEGSGVMFLSRLGVVDPEPEPPPSGEGELDLYLVSASPNPFLVEVELIYHLNQDALVRARVFTIKGYLIRDLGEFAGNDGDNSLSWNGLDDNGRPTPAGLYLFYLESEDKTARGQVIRLR